jgi:hypothetical protein
VTEKAIVSALIWAIVKPLVASAKTEHRVTSAVFIVVPQQVRSEHKEHLVAHITKVAKVAQDGS